MYVPYFFSYQDTCIPSRQFTVLPCYFYINILKYTWFYVGTRSIQKDESSVLTQNPNMLCAHKFQSCSPATSPQTKPCHATSTLFNGCKYEAMIRAAMVLLHRPCWMDAYERIIRKEALFFIAARAVSAASWCSVEGWCFTRWSWHFRGCWCERGACLEFLVLSFVFF